MSNEFRVIDFPVGEREVLDLFAMRVGAFRPSHYIESRWEPPLPRDARVVAVHHDFWHRCFYFRCEHPSFPEFAEGSPIPRAVESLRVVESDSPVVIDPDNVAAEIGRQSIYERTKVVVAALTDTAS